MNQSIKMSLMVVLCGALLAAAASQHSLQWQGLPLFAVCVAAAFAVQVIGFIPSYLKQTERYYDLTGSLTYLAIMVFLLLVVESLDDRSIILAAMVIVWAARLGSFLFVRISKDGADNRFDKIKPFADRLLATWLLQGLWVSITAAAAWAAILAPEKTVLSWPALIGCALWLVGFLIEVLADYQKRVFRAQQAVSGQRFIHTGLWAYSRHPNYFGEIMLWVGVAIVALPVLSGWSYITLISPIFVFVLLTRLSGVPMLEKSADKKFAGDPLYESYKKQTPVLLPRLTKPSYLQETSS